MQNKHARKRSNGNGKIGWDYYARCNEIEEFVKQVVQDNQDIASYDVIGQSFENRNIYAVKVATRPNNKRAILIDASKPAYMHIFCFVFIPVDDHSN